MDTMILKAGTIVHVQGTPVALTTDIVVETSLGNQELITRDLAAPRTATSYSGSSHTLSNQ